MNVITAYSSKGGTTKTTTVANFGGYLAFCGYKVLLIDGDNTQPSLSSYYPITDQAPHGLVHLIKSRKISDDLISKTNIEGLDIVYADDNRMELSAFINDSTDGRFRMRRAIHEFRDQFPDSYDYILTDTRGAKGLLVDSSLIASDIVFSPIPPDKISATEFFRGTVDRYRTVADEVRFMNINMGPLLAFMSRVEPTNDAKAITGTICDLIGDCTDIFLLDTIIPSSTAYKSAASAQIPIHLFDTKDYKSMKNGAEIMISLWDEMMACYAKTLTRTKNSTHSGGSL